MEIRPSTFALPDQTGPAPRSRQQNQNSFNARVDITNSATQADKQHSTSLFQRQIRDPAIISGSAIQPVKRTSISQLNPEQPFRPQPASRPATFGTQKAITAYRQIDSTRFQPTEVELLNRIDTQV